MLSFYLAHFFIRLVAAPGQAREEESTLCLTDDDDQFRHLEACLVAMT